MGIVTSKGEVSTIPIKNQERDVKKRNLTILDETSSSIDVTLWGKNADIDLPDMEGLIVAIKGARVSDYNRNINPYCSNCWQIEP
jgi:replication factor A1